MDEAEFDKFAAEYEREHTENIRVSGESPAFFAKYKVDDVVAALRGLGREPTRILDFGAASETRSASSSMRFRAAVSSSSIRLRSRWTSRANATRAAQCSRFSTAKRSHIRTDHST